MNEIEEINRLILKCINEIKKNDSEISERLDKNKKAETKLEHLKQKYEEVLRNGAG